MLHIFTIIQNILTQAANIKQIRVPTPPAKILEGPGIFTGKFSGPRKSWKMTLVLESPGIC